MKAEEITEMWKRRGAREVWIVEDISPGGGVRSVWADDVPAIEETNRLREAEGYHFQAVCWQVQR